MERGNWYELTLRNGDVLEKQNDSRYRQLAGHRGNEILVNYRRADVLEAARDRLQNLDGILARLALVISAVQPGCDCQDDNHKGIPEH